MATKQPTYSGLKLELETVLDSLQQDGISVDDALKAYARGMELVKQLEATLKDAENKITKLKQKFE